MTLCNAMTSDPKLSITAIPVNCSPPQADPSGRSVADRIAAFLDGRTEGEDLLHELYDHVLAEPIPQRMRDLLKR